jgi:hypothetical protein
LLDSKNIIQYVEDHIGRKTNARISLYELKRIHDGDSETDFKTFISSLFKDYSYKILREEKVLIVYSEKDEIDHIVFKTIDNNLYVTFNNLNKSAEKKIACVIIDEMRDKSETINISFTENLLEINFIEPIIPDHLLQILIKDICTRFGVE